MPNLTQTTQDCRDKSFYSLLTCYEFLAKASMRTSDKKLLKELKKKRLQVNLKLDGLILAELNTNLLPAKVQEALGNLKKQTKDLEKAKKKIVQTTATIKQISDAMETVTKIIGSISSLLVFL